MAYTTAKIEDFKGLSLDQDGLSMGWQYAIESINLDYTQNGHIKQRDGFTKISTVAQAAGIKFMLYRPISKRVLTIGPGEINTYTVATGVKNVPTGSPTWVATAVTPPAAFGTGTLQRYVYIASTNAGAGVQYRRFEDNPLANDVQSGPTASKPQFVAVFPGQNRMVHAGFYAAADAPGGANGETSTVFFSGENTPDTFDPTDFVRLDPGDGEPLTGVAGYQNQLFVFKNSKMFVFYGVSPDDDGSPVFDFRSITLPDPIPATSDPTKWTPVSVGPDGVYFVGGTGLWKTTGGTPTRVDISVTGMFDGSVASINSRFQQENQGEVDTLWCGDTFFMQFKPTGLSTKTTVFWDRQVNAWGTWKTLSSVYDSLPIASPTGRLISINTVSTPGHVYRQVAGSIADDGNALSWQYTTGFDELGAPGEKRVRYTDIWGEDTITVQLSTKGDRQSATSTASKNITLSNGAAGPFRARLSTPLVGRVFSMSVLGTAVAAPCSLSRIEVRYSDGSPV